mmetsp:Transcript_80987/g.225370  ORF Transcript_80987/g.225370 Transcript_80987/m.225370 type:complete len:311 (+) Transcript_80987:180-1112(+)
MRFTVEEQIPGLYACAREVQHHSADVPCGAARTDHLMRLSEIVRDSLVLVNFEIESTMNVRPAVERAKKTRQVLLLRHVCRVVLGVVPISDLELHLVEDGRIRSEKHHARVDAGRLLVARQFVARPPRRMAPQIRVGNFIAVAWYRRPAFHGGRWPQVEKRLDATSFSVRCCRGRRSNEEVEVQKEHFVESGQLQHAQLRKHVDKAALPPIVEEGAGHTSEVCDALARPTHRTQHVDVLPRHVRRVEEDPRWALTTMAKQPPAHHERAQEVRVTSWSIQQGRVCVSRSGGRHSGASVANGHRRRGLLSNG